MNRKTIFIFIIIFLLLPIDALALGISPGELGEYDFQPNLRVEKRICVSNSIEGYFEVDMVLRGNLTEYAKLSEDHFVLAPKGTPGSGKCVDFVLQLPEKLEKPGTYKLWVWASQVTGEQAGGSGSMLGGRVEVGANLKIHLPYPGKYVEASLTIQEGEVNETIAFTINAINRGNETINNAQGTIHIYDSGGREIATVKTNSESMEPSKWTELRAEWIANVEPGEFLANATIDYDGFKTFVSRTFKVGSPTAKILDVKTEPIVNGSIGVIKTRVISYWSKKIENAHVSLLIKRGSYSGGSQSPSATLHPWKETEFTNFWDTSNAIGPGEYQAVAVLHYLNKTDSKNFTIEVIEEERPILEIFLSDPMWTAVIALVIILVIMILLTFRKRKRIVQKKLSRL